MSQRIEANRRLLPRQHRQAGALGLASEAQRQAVRDRLDGGSWQLVGEYTEVESGRHKARPELAKALAACKKHKAKLVVAKLDRLSRNAGLLLHPARQRCRGSVCRHAAYPRGNGQVRGWHHGTGRRA
jgi:hypothetical protein